MYSDRTSVGWIVTLPPADLVDVLQLFRVHAREAAAWPRLP
jgi:hypothetical protein